MVVIGDDGSFAEIALKSAGTVIGTSKQGEITTNKTNIYQLT